MSNAEKPTNENLHPERPKAPGDPVGCIIYVGKYEFSPTSPISVSPNQSVQFKLGDGRTTDAAVQVREGLFAVTTITVSSEPARSGLDFPVSLSADGDHAISADRDGGQLNDPMQGTIRVGSGTGEDG